jgi:hypothetical protein
MITKFLGQPDDFATNPFYGSATPMRLFSVARVEAAEALPDFAEQKARSGQRQKAAAKGVQTKKAALHGARGPIRRSGSRS